MKVKYDKIGNDYNLTRKADTHLVNCLIKHLKPNKIDNYIDIGCGTGNYTIALNEKGYSFLGVDPSKKMLDVAKQKASNITWKKGVAEDLPFEVGCFSGAIATLTTHHWNDLNKAFADIYRVLKAESRFVVFTSNRELMEGYWLNHYFPQMLEKSMVQMPTYEFTREALEQNDFEVIETEKYFVQSDLEDLFLYSGKHKPTLYLDSKFRNGISSFTDLANSDEVNSGLERLEADISNHKIKDVIANYQNNKGDYMYIISKKRK